MRDSPPLPPARRPRPWVPSNEAAAQTGCKHVEYEDDLVNRDRDTDDQRLDEIGGIEHSIRPEVPCPEIVLVAVMTDGSYLLMAYPQKEPAAFVTAQDALRLRRKLAAAFGSDEDL